jgi:hypothetical protein
VKENCHRYAKSLKEMSETNEQAGKSFTLS